MFKFLQLYLWSEIQNQFVKSVLLFSVIFSFPSLQIADANTSKKLIQPDDPRINKLLATHYDCSEQYILSQFSLTWVQKCTLALFENENTRTFASSNIRFKAKSFKYFRYSELVQKNIKFCVQCAHHKWYRDDRMDWHTNFKSLPKNSYKNTIRNFIGTDSAERNQYSYIDSFTLFLRLNFQVQIEKKQTLFNVTKLNTVHNGVFTYKPKIYD